MRMNRVYVCVVYVYGYHSLPLHVDVQQSLCHQRLVASLATFDLILRLVTHLEGLHQAAVLREVSAVVGSCA